VTMYVELVTPEGQIWSGDAQRVIAKTLDGDIGVLTGHSPVLGILAEGSLVRILPGESDAAGATELRAAVDGGFLAVADDRVSILARQAQLGSEVDRAGAQAALDAAEEAAGPGGEETTDVRYFRALLRANSDRA
jgi:F-type H+-transporting ATPase subunit epsilon